MTLRTFAGVTLFLLARSLSGQSPLPETLEMQMQRQGLVDVRRLDPSICVDLKYSTVDNFMHADVYGDLETCYLQKEVAAMLVKAQRLLKQQRPAFFLKVFDGARPRRVQEIMWKLVKGTADQKYVANPATGSMHNFGSAVDLTVTDERRVDLDMGTPYDFFGELAQPRYETRFLQAGTLTQDQVEHRTMLRNTMIAAGFKPISNEWWHFDAYSPSVVRERYQIIP
jgi:D-alanyl-D-alanine dipeptidase